MKKIKNIIVYILAIAIIVAVPILSNKLTNANDSYFNRHKINYKAIITLWHIDVFEGGIGSRQDFLLNTALQFEKINKGVIVTVINHTVESAEASLKKGVIPDMISYGQGVDFVIDHAIPLTDCNLDWCELNGKCYAVPWCYGGYFLIGKTADNGAIDQLIISKNQFTMPEVAVFYENIDMDIDEKYSPLVAYSSFLQSKNDKRFLATQRDVFRLTLRGVEFTAKPLLQFSDIFQYISIFTTDKMKNYYCNQFVNYLTCQKVQVGLNKIGMFSYFYKNIPYDIDCLNEFQKGNINYTLSPYITKGQIEQINGLIEQKDKDNIKNNVKNYIKRL